MCFLMTLFVSAEILNFVIQMIRYEKLWWSYIIVFYIIMYHLSIFLITDDFINNIRIY